MSAVNPNGIITKEVTLYDADGNPIGTAYPLSSTEPPIEADADFTQIITVDTAGVPETGPDVDNPTGWMLEADPDNTGTAWFMYTGQTADAKGYPLAVGFPRPAKVSNLSDLDFDVTTSGDKIHAVKI